VESSFRPKRSKAEGKLPVRPSVVVPPLQVHSDEQGSGGLLASLGGERSRMSTNHQPSLLVCQIPMSTFSSQQQAFPSVANLLDDINTGTKRCRLPRVRSTLTLSCNLEHLPAAGLHSAYLCVSDLVHPAPALQQPVSLVSSFVTPPFFQSCTSLHQRPPRLHAQLAGPIKHRQHIKHSEPLLEPQQSFS